MQRILIIDDDQYLCELLDRFLTKNKFEVETSVSSQQGVEKFKAKPFDLVICDFRIDGKNGVEVFQELKLLNPVVRFIMITGYSEIKTAVEIIKEGAFDYIAKPLIPDEILRVVNKTIAQEAPVSGKENLQRVTLPRITRDDEMVVGNTREITEVFKQVKLVASTNYSVIIYGESGTGKEMMARAIHAASSRSKHPFVALDCGTLSRELAGSELFGHVKGSFTGAINDRAGHFEMANHGTLFLDEVANLSIEIQASLLRVLQERKLKRVGGTKEIKVDIRVLVASNENLKECCRAGKFREDLYHRLNEFSIIVPPLRNRKEDIGLFADFFLAKANMELNKNVTGFDSEVMELFTEYKWPGNLREMMNVVRRLTLLSKDDTLIKSNQLPLEITATSVQSTNA